MAFVHGDAVHVADDLGPSMQHFEAGQDAIVMYSYADKYGGANTDSYCLLFLDGHEVSWYYESQLTFLRHVDEGFIDGIKAARERLDREHAELPWIVAHWPEAQKTGASLQALASEIGFGSLWGSSGEGIAWFKNAELIRRVFDEPMRTGDVAAVQRRMRDIKAEILMRRRFSRAAPRPSCMPCAPLLRLKQP